MVEKERNEESRSEILAGSVNVVRYTNGTFAKIRCEPFDSSYAASYKYVFGRTSQFLATTHEY